jgi:serine/threonine protein kinase
LIHRDIKPENIMVYQVEGKWKVEIIDYDLSTEIKAKDANHLGTYQYKAPEMLLQLEYDESVDVYSAAMTVALLWQDREMTDMIFTNYNDLEKISEIRSRHAEAGIQFNVANKAVSKLLNQCAALDASKRPTIDDCIHQAERAYKQSL